MTRGEYNALRGWTPPEGESQDEPGYVVEYLDGLGGRNVQGFDGYVSWSPKAVFEASYRESDTPRQRVSIELEQLLERKGKLEKFIHFNPAFGALDPGVQALLRVQLGAMQTYRTCLVEREKLNG